MVAGSANIGWKRAVCGVHRFVDSGCKSFSSRLKMILNSRWCRWRAWAVSLCASALGFVGVVDAFVVVVNAVPCFIGAAPSPAGVAVAPSASLLCLPSLCLLLCG